MTRFFCASALLFSLATSIQAEVASFSFIHMSDVHINPFLSPPPESLEGERSWEAVRGAVGLGEMVLEPYGVKAPPPEFTIVTGDVTEYGWPNYTEQVVDRYFDGVTRAIYHCVGNHDNTWVTPSKVFRERYGGMNYTFDHGGVRFISLQTASFQEPLPSVGVEMLRFLRDTLEDTPKEMPVILFFHHPLAGLASEYEQDLLKQETRGHNVLAMLVGHHHSTTIDDYDGVPGLHGGSPFMKNQKEGEKDKRGYTVFTVTNGRLYGAHKFFPDENPSKGMAEIDLESIRNYPDVSLVAQTDAEDPTAITLQAEIPESAGRIREVRLKIDGEQVQRIASTWRISYKAEGLGSGAHTARVEFETEGSDIYYYSTAFHLNESSMPKQGRVLWRTFLEGSSQAAPVIADGVLYVGANDGSFQAMNAATGERVWRSDIGVEVVGEAALYKDSVLLGSGDGFVYALKKDTGNLVWKADTGESIYSTPVIQDEVVYIGNNAAEVVALNADSGEILWKNGDAEYSIEVPPVYSEGHVYFGDWGGRVFGVNANDGSLAWKQHAPRCEERIIRYYAAGDAPVVAGNGKIYVADRGYYLGAYELDGTYAGKIAEDVAAISPFADGSGMILRRGARGVTKMNWGGEEIWVSDVIAGRHPIPPTVTEDAIYVCTNLGGLYALDPADGSVLWQYQVTPQLRVYSQVAAADGIVYTTGMDGSLTAIQAPARKN